MKLITSRQKDVSFVFCSDPIVIDKRSSWGLDAANLQEAPNGAFLKMKTATVVSHLVQPNADKTAPVGWVPGSGPGLFDKAPIWVTEEVIPAGQKVSMNTLDGNLEYTSDVPSMVCYNGTTDGPNLSDGWVQKIVDLQKNYNF